MYSPASKLGPSTSLVCTVVGARDLPNRQGIFGMSTFESFVKIYLGESAAQNNQVFRTTSVQREGTPQWNEHFEIPMIASAPYREVIFKLFDKGTLGSDYVAFCGVNFADLLGRGVVDSFFQLRDRADQPHGQLHLQIGLIDPVISGSSAPPAYTDDSSYNYQGPGFVPNSSPYPPVSSYPQAAPAPYATPSQYTVPPAGTPTYVMQQQPPPPPTYLMQQQQPPPATVIMQQQPTPPTYVVQQTPPTVIYARPNYYPGYVGPGLGLGLGLGLGYGAGAAFGYPHHGFGMAPFGGHHGGFGGHHR